MRTRAAADGGDEALAERFSVLVARRQPYGQPAIEIPVAPGDDAFWGGDEEMRGHQAEDVFEAGHFLPVDRPRANHHEVRHAFHRRRGRDIRMREQRFDLGGEGEEAIAAEVVERSDAERIAREYDAPRRRIVESEREVAVELFCEGVTPLRVCREDAAGVARIARQSERVDDLVAAVDAAIEDEPHTLCRDHGQRLVHFLGSYPEVLLHERNCSRRPPAFTVRTAMAQSAAHA